MDYRARGTGASNVCTTDMNNLKEEPAEALYRRYTRRASRENMDDSFDEENSVDLSYSDLDSFPEFLLDRATFVKSLQLDHNLITVLPRCVGSFKQLVTLDISNNQMSYLSTEIVHLHNLRTLNARNNNLDNESIPKEMAVMDNLQVLNFSGNHLSELPLQFTFLHKLKCLYLGANSIETVPKEIGHLKRYFISRYFFFTPYI